MNKNNQQNRKKFKWNWPELKLEYFNSSYKDVKGFFEEQYGLYNGNIRLKTTGWSKAKDEWQDQILKTALDQVKTKKAEVLIENLNLVITEINLRLHSHKTIGQMSLKDLKASWEILRCESGLPTRILHLPPSNQREDFTGVKERILEMLDKRRNTNKVTQ